MKRLAFAGALGGALGGGSLGAAFDGILNPESSSSSSSSPPNRLDGYFLAVEPIPGSGFGGAMGALGLKPNPESSSSSSSSSLKSVAGFF